VEVEVVAAVEGVVVAEVAVGEVGEVETRRPISYIDVEGVVASRRFQREFGASSERR
jgi:hypothetical protein